MEKKVRRNLQYTVQNLGDEVIIYTRTTKEYSFEFCVSFPVEKLDNGRASCKLPYIGLDFVNKIIELVNQGYKQIP